MGLHLNDIVAVVTVGQSNCRAENANRYDRALRPVSKVVTDRAFSALRVRTAQKPASLANMQLE